MEAGGLGGHFSARHSWSTWARLCWSLASFVVEVKIATEVGPCDKVASDKVINGVSAGADQDSRLACFSAATSRTVLRREPRRIRVGVPEGVQCADLISATRLLVERALEWQIPHFFAQVDFAKAYGSVMHSAIWRCMRCRGVPEVLVKSYLREIRATKMCFQHSSWSTAPAWPVVGLRQRLQYVALGLPMCVVRCHGECG